MLQRSVLFKSLIRKRPWWEQPADSYLQFSEELYFEYHDSTHPWMDIAENGFVKKRRNVEESPLVFSCNHPLLLLKLNANIVGAFAVALNFAEIMRGWDAPTDN